MLNPQIYLFLKKKKKKDYDVMMSSFVMTFSIKLNFICLLYLACNFVSEDCIRTCADRIHIAKRGF